ncbi:MAG: hypothetical protein IJH63_00220 [Methanobrevibacter sp.]|nr:hypothetical protein [Methanobrevibacter sp.]
MNTNVFILTQKEKETIKMNLKEFANEIRNSTELIVTEYDNIIKVEALELELNHELEEVLANVQFMDNLKLEKLDVLSAVISEV